MNGANILIIDDDPAFIRKLSRVLSGAGYQVLTAETGEAAVEVLEQHRPGIQLVICDLVLPRMSGFDIIGCLTRHGAWKIIAASQVFRNPLLEHICTRLGVDAFVEKPKVGDPLNAGKWISAVQDVLAGAGAAGQATHPPVQ